MATEISDWSANDLENIRLDEINLSREQGEEVAKLMGAIKRKFNAVDAAISGAGSGWVWNPVPVYDEVLEDGFVYDDEDGLPYSLPSSVFSGSPKGVAIYIEGGTVSTSDNYNTLLSFSDGYTSQVFVNIPVTETAGGNAFSLCVETFVLNGQYFVAGFSGKQIHYYGAIVPSAPVPHLKFLPPTVAGYVSGFDVYASIPAGAQVKVFVPAES